MRGVASDLLVFLQRDLDMVGTPSIVAFTNELEIARHLLDVDAIEAERSLLDTLVHVTEERFVCGQPGGVQERDVTTALASSYDLPSTTLKPRPVFSTRA